MSVSAASFNFTVSQSSQGASKSASSEGPDFAQSLAGLSGQNPVIGGNGGWLIAVNPQTGQAGYYEMWGTNAAGDRVEMTGYAKQGEQASDLGGDLNKMMADMQGGNQGDSASWLNNILGDIKTIAGESSAGIAAAAYGANAGSDDFDYADLLAQPGNNPTVS